MLVAFRLYMVYRSVWKHFSKATLKLAMNMKLFLLLILALLQTVFGRKPLGLLDKKEVIKGAIDYRNIRNIVYPRVKYNDFRRKVLVQRKP
ncbi:unnamed protein product [Ceratitis capitata]|uniref:(Mediterranean fruit fly) hypothetical protein n=1 Tax=Ceratitis capitata TaxID=7213 RepID=A0A811V8I0_CERCA|nr:unnamed protein product [Ceratitis capitata]